MKNTNQLDRNDPHKVSKLVEEEWDQTDTWLAKYGWNSEQMSDQKLYSGHVRPGTGYVWFWRIYPEKLSDMSGPPRNFLLNFDYWAMRHQIGWNTVILMRIKGLQGKETTTTSSHSLEDWRDLSLSLISSLTPWSTPTPLKKQL
jgi:hypothetical protein